MKNRRSVFAAFTMIIQFGLNMLVPIVICTLLGVYIGKKYNMPAITVFLFMIGALAGFRSIFVMAKRFYQNDTDVRQEDNRTDRDEYLKRK